MRAEAGTVTSVNIAQVRTVVRNGTPHSTGIWKLPVDGPVRVGHHGLEGDVQVDTRHHGGHDKAVYTYAAEDEEWWAQALGRSVGPGTFGENLTVASVDVSGARIGERWRVGTALLEVSEPRLPCWKLGERMHDASFPRRFAAEDRPGAYLRVVETGAVSVGDTVTVIDRPDTPLTIAGFAFVYHHDRSNARVLLDTPAVSAKWREWAGRHAGP